MFESVKISGEAAIAALDAAEYYPDIISEIIKEGEYIRDKIFSVNETSLFWKRILFKNEKMRWHKPEGSHHGYI